jgi:hypothetical protein
MPAAAQLGDKIILLSKLSLPNAWGTEDWAIPPLSAGISKVNASVCHKAACNFKCPCVYRHLLAWAPDCFCIQHHCIIATTSWPKQKQICTQVKEVPSEVSSPPPVSTSLQCCSTSTGSQYAHALTLKSWFTPTKLSTTLEPSACLTSFYHPTSHTPFAPPGKSPFSIPTADKHLWVTGSFSFAAPRLWNFQSISGL